MNDYIAELTLDLNCEKNCQAIVLTQFDKGKKLHLTVTSNGQPYSVSGCSVVLKGVNADGSRVAIDCDIETDGTATAVTDDISFSVKGIAAARFVVSDSTRSYNTQRFLIYVDDALDADITGDERYSVLERMIRQIQLIDEHGGILVDDEVNSSSTHPVQNRAVAAALNQKLGDQNGVIFENHLSALLKNTLFRVDTATTEVPFFTDPKTVYLNAVINGSRAVVMTAADGSFQVGLRRDSAANGAVLLFRVATGGSSCSDWMDALSGKENASNKVRTITADDLGSAVRYPSVKAMVNYLLANYYDSDDVDDLMNTQTQFLDAVERRLDGEISDVKAYIGYTESDILGLHVDLENSRFERLAGAVGLSAGADFDAFPMYGNRRRVVVESDGEIQDVAPEDIDETDTNYDVMVYQPRFYYKVVPLKLEKQESGLGYHIRKANYYISATPHAGFKLHPLFYDADGNEVEYVLLSAYEASYLWNRQVSTSGVVPTYFNDSEDSDAAIDGTAVLKSMPNVKPISGLHKNMTRTQFEALAQRKSENWHLDTIQSVSANQLLMMIEFGQLNFQSAIGQGVVSLTNTAGKNCAVLTGATASLGSATGEAASAIQDETTVTGSGKVSVSYRGMENPWGNLWKFTQGVNAWGDGAMNGGQLYIAQHLTFAESTHTGDYQPCGFTLPNAGTWIKSLGYGSDAFDWLLAPSESGGNSALPVGDTYYTQSNITAHRAARTGGEWSSGVAAGGFFFASDIAWNTAVRTIGGRLLYIPTAKGA